MFRVGRLSILGDLAYHIDLIENDLLAGISSKSRRFFLFEDRLKNSKCRS